MRSQIESWTSSCLPGSLFGVSQIRLRLTLLPSVEMYRSSNASSTYRRIREVLPTAASPIIQILALRTPVRSKGRELSRGTYENYDAVIAFERAIVYGCPKPCPATAP